MKMNKLIKGSLVLVASVFAISNIHAQGCSDAGVCSIHSIKNNTEGNSGDDNGKNEIGVGISFGKGERSVSYYTPYVEYTRSLSNQTSVTGRLGYSAISGELANTTGFNDLFLSVNHAYGVKGKWKKSFVVGLKIPFDKADIIEDGIHLPMPYQTSLGTTDIVLGLNFIRKSFGATVALQQPLTSANGNRFLPGDYPATPLTLEYLPSNRFIRKGDVLLRTSYNFDIDKKFSIRPSLLGIYHINNDSYEDLNKARRLIYNSDGLTLNGNLFFDYKLNGGSSFELSVGTPFIIRDKRPDGLTRSFVAALEYHFSF